MEGPPIGNLLQFNYIGNADQWLNGSQPSDSKPTYDQNGFCTSCNQCVLVDEASYPYCILDEGNNVILDESYIT